jgi:DNA-binding FadR family transcriptional regulator
MLRPVRRQSVSDAVFEQLRDQIVSGTLEPGAALPSERLLCEALRVNRGSVREALRRLEQARLVSVRHGGTSQVLDYRSSAGLDLLGDLVLRPTGEVDLAVLRGIVEMRSAIAPDVARLAARRGGEPAAEALDREVAAMRAAKGDLAALQDLAAEFWSRLVDASDNLPYRLAYNSLRASYDLCRELFTRLMAREFSDVEAYAEIARAVRRRDEPAAESRARALVRRGEQALAGALTELSACTQEKDA